jgi:hypothetical protein
VVRWDTNRAARSDERKMMETKNSDVDVDMGLVENQPFPFPGARILSLWVGEQVKLQLQMGASTDEILGVVRGVLDENDKKHGARPIASKAELDGGER